MLNNIKLYKQFRLTRTALHHNVTWPGVTWRWRRLLLLKKQMKS